MASQAKDTSATIIPALRYRDARAAIEFLCRAFGFEKTLVVDGPNNTIAHAQLTFGNGMIMLGSIRMKANTASGCSRRSRRRS